MSKKVWKDETGLEIPANRITKSEKMREAATDKLLKKAEKLNQLLITFKDEFIETSDEIYKAILEENGAKAGERKGNFIYHNFDRSVKVETDVQDRIEFDDAMITVAKQHFDEFLSSNTTGIDDLIRELILDAFSSTRGKLDTRKVMSLVKHRSRIPADKYPQFHAAINAIEKGMSRPTSKRYFRISLRDTEGKYNAIDLNFSSI
jgi:hypothetical protein